MPGDIAGATSIANGPLQTGDRGRAHTALRRLGERIEARFDAERDQLPLWLPVGFGLGIAAWFALPDSGAWSAFLLGAAACALGFLALAGGTRSGRALAIFALAAALGTALIWTNAERVAAPRLEYARMAAFEAKVESVQRLAAKETVRLVVRPAAEAELPPRLRINVDEEKAAGIAAGATVRLRAWVMPPPAMAVPGAYDFSRVAWFQGIGGTGRASGEVVIVAPPRDQGWRARIAEWRQGLADHIVERLDGGAGVSRPPWRPATRARFPKRMRKRCGDRGWRICCRCRVCT